MHYGKGNKPNLHIDDSQAFTKKLKHLDNTYTNRMISKVRVNVPDLTDYRASRFDIGADYLEGPLTCSIESNTNNMLKNIRPISTPEFKPYEYKMTPFNDYIPFVERQVERPHGELYYRRETLKPLSEMPK